MKNKYSSPCYLNQFNGEECSKGDTHAIHFASKLEANVYRILLKNNCQIVRQRNLEVKPKTAIFAAIHWAVDFRVWSRTNTSLGHLNIEAKGLSFDDFILKVQMLEYCNLPEFQATRIIIDNFNTPIPRALNPLVESEKVIEIGNFSTYLTEIGF